MQFCSIICYARINTAAQRGIKSRSVSSTTHFQVKNVSLNSLNLSDYGGKTTLSENLWPFRFCRQTTETMQLLLSATPLSSGSKEHTQLHVLSDDSTWSQSCCCPTGWQTHSGQQLQAFAAAPPRTCVTSFSCLNLEGVIIFLFWIKVQTQAKNLP